MQFDILNVLLQFMFSTAVKAKLQSQIQFRYLYFYLSKECMSQFSYRNLITKKLSRGCSYDSAPTGPCLNCTGGLKHDGTVAVTDGLGKDTASQRWAAPATKPAVAQYQNRFTCGWRRQNYLFHFTGFLYHLGTKCTITRNHIFNILFN